jgi:hypothetical protein
MLLRMSSLNPVEFSVRVTSPSEANYTAEARFIQTAAAARRTHVVKLEQIVFFSTSTGDAWMLDSVDRSAVCLAREGEIKESKRGNLLDHLNPAGLDERLARSCRGILGVNVPRARLMLEAHELLLRFAERHQLVSAGDVAATQSELIRLRGVLDT